MVSFRGKKTGSERGSRRAISHHTEGLSEVSAAISKVGLASHQCSFCISSEHLLSNFLSKAG